MFKIRRAGKYMQVVIEHEGSQFDLGLFDEIELADLYETIRRDLEDMYEYISKEE